jgi:hypothetical protein
MRSKEHIRRTTKNLDRVDRLEYLRRMTKYFSSNALRYAEEHHFFLQVPRLRPLFF